MHIFSVRQNTRAVTRDHKQLSRTVLSSLVWLLFCVLLGTLSACTGPITDSSPDNATPAPVNGFGSRANHSHSLLSLPGNVLVLATHYGLFRSSDNGNNWRLVAAGQGQLMDGMMTYSLITSWSNPQRLYVLTQPSINNPAGTPGLYTSIDAGVSWQLAQKTADFGDMYTAAPGNRSADEVYVYASKQNENGLKVSLDGGRTFTSPGKLPYGRILGVLAPPAERGTLLIYSNDGVSRSRDGGKSWQVVKTIEGAIYGMTTAGPGKPIYATGDAGIYASQDGGKSFTLVYAQARYGSLIASPMQAQVLYGKTGQFVYQSSDGGRSWQALPKLKGNLENIAPSNSQAGNLFLALSYPTEVYRFDPQKKNWSALTPPKQ